MYKQKFQKSLSDDVSTQIPDETGKLLGKHLPLSSPHLPSLSLSSINHLFLAGLATPKYHFIAQSLNAALQDNGAVDQVCPLSPLFIPPLFIPFPYSSPLLLASSPLLTSLLSYPLLSGHHSGSDWKRHLRRHQPRQRCLPTTLQQKLCGWYHLILILLPSYFIHFLISSFDLLFFYVVVYF